MKTLQVTFNPAHTEHFRWEGDWYRFDSEAAHRAALATRNQRARELRRQGWRVRCFSLRDQLVSRGGIGSGHPHIELWVTAYGLDATKEA